MTTAASKPAIELKQYKPNDFATDQEVRWCPGCGDYAVLASVRKALAKIGKAPHDYVFVSGIGCAARFPYYMNTYGLHTLHGRGLPVATGVKLANPDIDVCVVSGDGDLLSIGGGHTIHAMRRNLDMTILLLNNRIYGLTKGQYSPTSEAGKVTKSTPMGSLDHPINPIATAVSAGCTFIARSIDVDVKLFDAIFQRATDHRGTAFVEIYQDCNIFNHQAWFYASQKATKADTTVMLEQGKPLVFGAEKNKGIRFTNGALEVVTFEGDAADADLLIHDETNDIQAFMLSQMRQPDFPEPIGILYADPSRPTYDALVQEQMAAARQKRNVADDGTGIDLQALLNGSETWTVED